MSVGFPKVALRGGGVGAMGEGVDRGTEALERRPARIGGELGHDGQLPRGGLGEGLGQQVALRREVPVEGARGHARGAGDVVHRRGAPAALGGKSQRGGDDRAAGAGPPLLADARTGVDGGGTARGVVYGSSDKAAAYPTSHAHDPSDLAATVYHCLGVPPDTTVHDQAGRPHQLVIGKKIDGLLG